MFVCWKDKVQSYQLLSNRRCSKQANCDCNHVPTSNASYNWEVVPTCMQQSVDQRCKQLYNMIMICDMHGGHVCKKTMSIEIVLKSSSLLSQSSHQCNLNRHRQQQNPGKNSGVPCYCFQAVQKATLDCDTKISITFVLHDNTVIQDCNIALQLCMTEHEHGGR